jgi:squalene-hopene/tetraprenyl-beta-curcumene cyclase
MKMRIAWSAVLMAAAAAVGGARDLPSATDDRLALSESLEREARAAVSRGVQWLLEKQGENGAWSNERFPALTGLPLWAIALSGEEHPEAVRKAVDYILSCVRPYGAIYRRPEEPRKGGGLSNYNTAICMVALRQTGDPALIPVILNARKFLAGTQHFGDDVYRGGMGYDATTGRAYTDLSNSYLAFEAMKLTQDVEDFRTEGERVSLDWEAAREFVERVHNDPQFNPQPWANPDPDERGGFAYHPEQTRAGTEEGADGAVHFRSMPGMTYAGLLSYIYADVDRDDPRIASTIRWIRNHFDLQSASRDPAKRGTDAEKEGLYYLYNVLSKGLATVGRDVYQPEDRPAFNWRVELIETLLAGQKIDPETGAGYWVNEVGRYWESDPVLVTSYALLSLEYALDGRGLPPLEGERER